MTVPECSWFLPPTNLTLSGDEVHVWCASLDLPSSDVENFENTLTVDERERAERFYFQKDRRRFIVGRGVLRAILSCYLNREPSELRFFYTVHGKPELATQSDGNAIRFNVSHSHEVALYAVTRGREIGIDVECIRPISEADQIAERLFSTREHAVFRALPAHESIGAFFTCWTRKEAYLKALGDGLARPLDEFDVLLAPGKPARLLYVQGDEEEVSRWSLRELTPAPGYAAALAVEADGWHLKCWNWMN